MVNPNKLPLIPPRRTHPRTTPMAGALMITYTYTYGVNRSQCRSAALRMAGRNCRRDRLLVLRVHTQ